MSNAVDMILAIAFAAIVSPLARTMMATGKLPLWWWGIAIVPLLSLGMALAVMLFPRPILDGWQEGDFDTGRADFMALVFFGAVVPIAYVAVAFPVVFVVRLLKTRRVKT